jgi:hypothetical protein
MRPRPCSGQLLEVPGVEGPVAALKTEFETDEIAFDAATRFIEPVNWKKCMPYFWCDMREMGKGMLPGMYLYHEVVSTDCAHKARAAFWAETELLFNFMWLPDHEHAAVALTNYQLSNGRPLPDDPIRVDEGTLVVAKIGPGQTPLRITTTKRIQFSYPFSSEALALIMCALGYADVVGDLLCCAASSPKRGKAGTKFPGESPPVVAHGPRPQAAPRRHPCSPICVGESSVGQLVQETANIWARVLREGATAVERGAGGGQPEARTRTRDRSEG